MDNKEQKHPQQGRSQDPFSTDSLSKEQFDEMDELALSLQKQIKNLDNIPELDNYIDDSLAEDKYESSEQQRNNQKDDFFQPQDNNQNLEQELKKHLLKQNRKQKTQLPALFKLRFIIPGLIGVFFVISLATYWLFSGSDDNELSNTQNMSLSLPEKPVSLLDEEQRVFELETEDNTEVKTIPLTYLDENTNKQQQTTDEYKKITAIESIEYVEKSVQQSELKNTASSDGKSIINETNDLIPELTQSSDMDTTAELKTEVKAPINSKNKLKKNNTSEVQAAPIISQIMPSPIIGNSKRQWIDIKGDNISLETILVLQWTEKAKSSVKLRTKIYSFKDKNSQLKLLSKTHLRLNINTGVTERTWHLKLKNQNRPSNDFKFNVVKPFTVAANKTKDQNKKIEVVNQESEKYQLYIKQQPDSNYTLQLLGSSNYKAIQKVLQKHKKFKELFWYKNKRDGKDWYTLFYGSYKNKEIALQSYNKLPSSLKSIKPWVRDIKTVKNQLTSNNRQVTDAVKKMRSSILSVPADKWTFQLISLSSEQALQKFIKNNKLGKQAKYFKRTVNGETLYTLIYSVYDSKKIASLAQKRLSPSILRQSKPWIRQYADIQKLIK